jgi:hypothetical protein
VDDLRAELSVRDPKLHADMAREFRDDDARYEAWVIAHPDG